VLAAHTHDLSRFPTFLIIMQVVSGVVWVTVGVALSDMNFVVPNAVALFVGGLELVEIHVLRHASLPHGKDSASGIAAGDVSDAGLRAEPAQDVDTRAVV
jgi:hypothetical protein